MSEENDNKPNLDVPEHLEYSDEHVWVDVSTEPYGIVPAASIVFFSFIGFDAVSSSAEETINPNKTLPRGILISLAVSTVLYIVMTLIMTGVVPYKEFANFIDAPVAGVIRYVNNEAADDPSIVTGDPYGEGWIFKIELEDDEPGLLSSEEYANIVAQ